ncbi:RNA chaperone Hfq [Sphingomicrobium flavum]|uniref:RNA chaperone Hfq n=1 Tax=Sphingomicrobium flavum TaxID=1229164 RepID=UPI0021AE0744|nr:RNA chaperone Hfq [Sphingomicrobium flavum]
MADNAQSLQHIFLNACRKQKLPVSLFLMKRVRLQGQVAGFGSYALLLQRDGAEQLVYKHSICSILPAQDPVIEAPAHHGESMQDDFLTRHLGNPLTVFLANGDMLKGKLMAHDNFVLLLGTRQGPQLLFKHALSTLQPGDNH